MYLRDVLPFHLLSTKGYGISVEDINWSCPADMEPYADAYLLEQKQNDMLCWYMGQYNMGALAATVGNMLKGKHGKTHEYVKKPFMQGLGEDYGLTQEEIDERELKKMLFNEEMWNRQLKKKGLPEPKIARR